MAVTVLDSGDLEAQIKDATGEGLEGNPALTETKEAVKDDAKPKEAAKDDSADEEDENGLTAAQKAELTAKMQKAIGKKTRQLREAEEFAAEEFKARRLAEARAQQLEQELAAVKAKPEQIIVPQEKAKPARENFASEAEYVQALIDHGIAEALQKKAAEDAEAAEAARQAQIMEQAKARIAKAIELVPDYVEVTQGADVAVSAVVAGYMQESDMFAELGYFLAQNQDVAKALAKMPPAKQLVEIGKIEAKLQPFGSDKEPASKKDADTKASKTDGQAKPAPREPTGEAPSAARRAAPVITPISTTSSGNTDLNLDTADVRDHIAEFARKRGVNLNRRQRH